MMMGMNDEIKVSARELRQYLEKMDRDSQQVETVVPELQDRKPRKHETAYAEGVRQAVRELLKMLKLKQTWLEELQMKERQLKGYKDFSYHDQDGTLYFGYFKSKTAFLNACLDETGNRGVRGETQWILNRIGTFNEGKYGVEAWVNLGKLCKEEVE